MTLDLPIGFEPPPVPGVTFRAWRDPSDYDRMAAIAEAARVADGLERTRTAAWMSAVTALAGADPQRAIIFAEGDRDAVAYVLALDWGLSPGIGRMLNHRGFVVPAWRRRGIGRSLLRIAQGGLSEAAPVEPGVPRILHSEAESDEIGAHVLLDSEGYLPVRYTIHMVRPHLLDPPDPTLPEGIEARQVHSRDEASRVIWAINEAMADHWAWTPIKETAIEPTIDHPILGQTDVWQVAWAGDEVVGGVLGWIDEEENRIRQRRRGYTEAIFTRRPWRHRGIARALIGRNLRLLQEHGMTEAALGVDLENPSGALRLYESCGFVENARTTTYELNLS